MHREGFMHISAKSLGLEKLPAADRLALISEIWDGLSAEVGSLSLTPEQSAELARRVAEDDEFPDETFSAESVFSELEARFTKKS
jgi:putative addiction module component (TIGR02574 family)